MSLSSIISCCLHLLTTYKVLCRFARSLNDSPHSISRRCDTMHTTQPDSSWFRYDSKIIRQLLRCRLWFTSLLSPRHFLSLSLYLYLLSDRFYLVNSEYSAHTWTWTFWGRRSRAHVVVRYLYECDYDAVGWTAFHQSHTCKCNSVACALPVPSYSEYKCNRRNAY